MSTPDLEICFVCTRTRAGQTHITHFGGIDGNGLPWIAPIDKVMSAMEAGLSYSACVGSTSEPVRLRTSGGIKTLALADDPDSRRLFALPRLL